MREFANGVENLLTHLLRHVESMASKLIQYRSNCCNKTLPLCINQQTECSGKRNTQ